MDERIYKFLYDINESIESIETYLGPLRDFSVYSSNKMLRRSVERELEIIGEAVNCIMKIDPSISISSARQIVSMRNRVIHNYDNVDNEIVWGIVVKYLPVLRSEVTALLPERK